MPNLISMSIIKHHEALCNVLWMMEVGYAHFTDEFGDEWLEVYSDDDEVNEVIDGYLK